MDLDTAKHKGEELGAAHVMECSARGGVGIEEVFESVVRVMAPRGGIEQYLKQTNEPSVPTNDPNPPPLPLCLPQVAQSESRSPQPPQMRSMAMWHAANDGHAEILARLLKDPFNDPNIADTVRSFI